MVQVRPIEMLTQQTNYSTGFPSTIPKAAVKILHALLFSSHSDINNVWAKPILLDTVNPRDAVNLSSSALGVSWTGGS